jgi:hypothetical protein
MGSRIRSWQFFIVALACASGMYWFAAVIGMNLLPGITAPDWWLPSSSRLARYLTWIHAKSFLGLALVSMPICLAIAATVARRPVVFALAAALLGTVVPTAILMLPHLSLMGTVSRVSMVGDIAKFLVTLPALTALAVSVLPSTRRQ